MYCFYFLTNPPSAKAVLPFAPTTGNRHSPGRPIRLLEYRYPIGNFALRQLSGAAPARYVYLEHAPGRLLIAEGGPKWPGGEASAIGTLLSECAARIGQTLPRGKVNNAHLHPSPCAV